GVVGGRKACLIDVPPIQSIRSTACSVFPCTVTVTLSTRARTISLRSAIVVSLALHKDGMSAASARIRSRSSGESRRGNSRRNRSPPKLIHRADLRAVRDPGVPQHPPGYSTRARESALLAPSTTPVKARKSSLRFGEISAEVCGEPVESKRRWLFRLRQEFHEVAQLRPREVLDHVLGHGRGAALLLVDVGLGDGEGLPLGGDQAEVGAV